MDLALAIDGLLRKNGDSSFRAIFGKSGGSSPTPSASVSRVPAALDLFDKLPCLLSTTVLKETRFGIWHKRVAVLTHSHLVLRKPSLGSLKPRAYRIFHLEECTVEVHSTRARYQRFGLVLTPPVSSGERPLRISFVSEAEQIQWAALLRQQILEITSTSAGDTLGSELVVLGALGEGATCDVHLVRHKPSNRLLALKRIPKRRLRRKVIVSERAALEATARFDIPFTQQLRWARETEDAWFMATDFAPAGDMVDVLNAQSGKRLTEPVLRLYAAQLTLALATLHHYGILHRDLKPENLLVDGRGNLSICDFGLAHVSPDQLHKAARSSRIRAARSASLPNPAAADDGVHALSAPKMRRRHSFVGTGRYIAPEILAGSEGHAQEVDFWGLGQVLYTMACGRAPFRDADELKQQHKILRSEVTFPDYVDLSQAMRDFICALLRKHPSDRLGAASQGGVASLFEHPVFEGIQWDATYLATRTALRPLGKASKRVEGLRHADPTSAPTLSSDSTLSSGSSLDTAGASCAGSIVENVLSPSCAAHLAPPAQPAWLASASLSDQHSLGPKGSGSVGSLSAPSRAPYLVMAGFEASFGLKVVAASDSH